ncbi:hypothetical protein B0H13DRAFT_1929079 [Mycena leptocephala]|nr:hypothetical protein B0H13DRAFT_1929079 [Mycena leptocephala]
MLLSSSMIEIAVSVKQMAAKHTLPPTLQNSSNSLACAHDCNVRLQRRQERCATSADSNSASTALHSSPPQRAHQELYCMHASLKRRVCRSTIAMYLRTADAAGDAAGDFAGFANPRISWRNSSRRPGKRVGMRTKAQFVGSTIGLCLQDPPKGGIELIQGATWVEMREGIEDQSPSSLVSQILLGTKSCSGGMRSENESESRKSSMRMVLGGMTIAGAPHITTANTPCTRGDGMVHTALCRTFGVLSL